MQNKLKMSHISCCKTTPPHPKDGHDPPSEKSLVWGLIWQKYSRLARFTNFTKHTGLLRKLSKFCHCQLDRKVPWWTRVYHKHTHNTIDIHQHIPSVIPPFSSSSLFSSAIWLWCSLPLPFGRGQTIGQNSSRSVGMCPRWKFSA